MHLDSSLKELNKVGKSAEKNLKKLGLNTVRDLLLYYPFRYEDFSQILKIGDLRGGETGTIRARVSLISNRRTRFKKIITEALVEDETGSIRVVWFNQSFLTKNLESGTVVFLSGNIKRDMLGLQMVSPAYETVREKNIHTGRLVPIYPLTQGLTQKQLRFLVLQSLPAVQEIEDWVPENFLREYGLAGLQTAIKKIHFPESEADIREATERLKFDELFLVQLQAEKSRIDRSGHEAPKIIFHEEEIKKFVASLPFTLTKDQKISAWEILKNTGDSVPMNRLLSGDVGSGKTVVASIALYNTVLSGYQGVLMAPTEILALQHFKTVSKILPQLKIVLFTAAEKFFFDGSVEEKKKSEILKLIASGEAQIVIGTHALIAEGVNYKNGGLVVVDEQHRFGVNQRKALKEKSFSGEKIGANSVHFLSMTATPIPRSLALMIYGDLDLSTIKELPPGRKTVLTRLVEPANREKAYDFIRSEVKKGRQVFVICPLIENNINDPAAEKKAVLSEYKKLSEDIFPEFKVQYLHGRMKSTEKDKQQVMEEFAEKKIDILVSTSVVEVGVDIPNASVMMIEGAERFGLAQLHQFRGRVGRGAHQSYCLLFTGAENERIRARLQYFAGHNNGFELAEKDLELRGPGEVYGTAQSGMMQLRLARITDREIIKKAREAARKLAPKLKEYKTAEQKFFEWEKTVHLE